MKTIVFDFDGTIADTFKHKIFQKKFVGVLITIIPAYILAVTNSYANLWRLFGSANQLIAAIALITISAYFIEHKKHIKFLIIPTVFMMVTTMAALIYSLFNKAGYIFTGNWLLAVISLILLVLAVIVSYEGFEVIKKYRKRI